MVNTIIKTGKSLSIDLLRINQTIQSNWCVLVDFNAVLDQDDELQARAITTYETQDFAEL